MNCLINAASVLLGISNTELVSLLGHDGSEKIWDYNEPFCFRGVHIQELQKVFVERGLCLYPVERCPMQAPPLKNAMAYLVPNWEDKFFELIHNKTGLALGIHPKTGIAHAGVLMNNRIYDELGQTYHDLHDFQLRCVYVLGKV